MVNFRKIHKIDYLYSLGISDSLSTYDACKLQIINRLAVLCAGLLLVLSVINAIIGNYIGIVIDLATLILVPIPVLFLNQRKLYKSATYLFLIGYHILVLVGSIHAISEGRANEVENFLFPGAIAIIILSNGMWQRIAFILNILGLVSMNYLRFIFTEKAIVPEFFQLLAMILVTYTGVYYFIAFFKNQLTEALEKTENLNNELSKKEQALLESNKSKDRLFTIVAHDLRSPLDLIKGLLDPLMLKSLEREKYMEYLGTIRTRISVLQETMHNLLSWAQSQLGNSKIKPVLVGIDAEIHGVIDIFAELLNAKRIAINHSGDKSLKAYVDRNHLNVILRNIIHNAIKFTPESGKIGVDLSSNEEKVCISISDSGSGIDETTIQRILERKMMISGTGTGGERGSGVGLSFCQDLLGKNQGVLKIENGESKGSVFEIHLPTS